MNFCYRDCLVLYTWRGPSYLLLQGLLCIFQLKMSKNVTFFWRGCSVFYSWRGLRMWPLLQGLLSIVHLKRSKLPSVTETVLYFTAEEVQRCERGLRFCQIQGQGGGTEGAQGVSSLLAVCIQPPALCFGFKIFFLIRLWLRLWGYLRLRIQLRVILFEICILKIYLLFFSFPREVPILKKKFFF